MGSWTYDWIRKRVNQLSPKLIRHLPILFFCFIYDGVYLLKIINTDVMIITTTHQIPNREIQEILGIARGSTVRARNIGRDFMAQLKNIVGGEIEEYTQLQAMAREQAISRMIEDAKRMNADAIIGIGFSTAMVMQGAAEIMAFGTAVKLK